MQVRSCQAPEYFEKEYSFGNKLVFPEVELSEYRAKSQAYKARLDELNQAASQIREELRTANEKQRIRIFDFFSNLEKSVDQTLNSDRQRRRQ